MSTALTVVMYHYVRKIEESDFPNLKGLELVAFQRQLDYFGKKFEMIAGEDVVSCLKNGIELPENACLLTFDDGYKDHHEFVLPELVKRGMQGCFFVPGGPVINNQMLDVNFIHFTLEACRDINDLVYDLRAECRRCGMSSKELSKLWETHAQSSRYDSKEVIFFKRMLQHVLPADIRHEISMTLFENYTGLNEVEFSKSLYMSLDDVRDLVGEGMYVGGHTFEHPWLNRMTKLEQEQEIQKSRCFLELVCGARSDLLMCYPYGAYNEDTIAILAQNGFVGAFTTEIGIADLNPSNALFLKRYDTNDFPQ